MKRLTGNVMITVSVAVVLAACGTSASPRTAATGSTATTSVVSPSTNQAAAPVISPSTPPARCLGSCTSVPAGAVTGKPGSSGAVTFISPSGNIGCDLYNDPSLSSASCAIVKADYTLSKPNTPLDCEGLALNTGAAEVMCRGDVMQWQIDQQNGAVATLAYGSTISFGPFVCHSDANGMSCWRPNTGHGFALSKQSYSTW